MSKSRNLSGCQIFSQNQLPLDWDCVFLRDRLELLYGRPLSGEVRKPGDVDVFGSNGKVGSHNVRWLDGPGVLVGRKGTVGAVHYTKKPFWPIDTVYYVKPINNDHLRYVYYLLDYLPLKFLNAATGVPGLSRRDAYALRGAFPPADEQIAIARILDAVDTAIELAQLAVIKAVDVRNSLLTELLSCGVDDHGQVRDPVRFANQFSKTSLGLLPRDWRLSKIGNEFDLQNGFTINASQQSNKQLRCYLRVANVHRDNLRLDDIQELQANDNEFAPRVLELNDLLVVEGHADRMQIGRCARVNEQAIGLTFQNHLFRLRTKGEILPYFGCLWLNSAYAQRYWNAQCATSSGLNTINQRMLKRMMLPVPSEPEQQIIETLIEKQRNHLDALRNKLSSLMELKKSLMHDLLTGTVCVDPALFKEITPL